MINLLNDEFCILYFLKKYSSITKRGDIEMSKSKGKIFVSILGIILGIVVIIIGLTAFNDTYKGTVSKEEYGGDAYTGIQQACAQTATNTYHIYEIIQTFSKIFFVILGIFVILHFLTVLCEDSKATAIQPTSEN